jgi:putative chitinase
MEKAGINTEARINAFLAQILHESGNLTATVENLNYSAERLMQINGWKKYFPNITVAKKYEHNPQALANYVYGKRMGNTAPNDGWLYKGRGIIGNTGKSQYIALKKATGIDFVSKPELLEQPKYAVFAAVKYWLDHGLNKKADAKDFHGITQSVNGGNIGQEDRDLKYKLLSGIKAGIKEGTDIVKKNKTSSFLIFFILFSIFAYAVTRINKS